MNYVYDEQGRLLGEYDSNGNPVYETVYLGSTPVGALKQTGTAANNNIAVAIYNVYADQIDTPRVITQQDHQIVWRWDQAEAFGASAPEQNPSSLGTFAYNQRFPGQVFDQETGLNQNMHREYSARLGRYIQSDPIGLKGGINPFAYVDGDPLRKIDPTGEAGLLGTAAGLGATAYGVYKMASTQNSCEKMCEVTHGDAVQACGDPERQDIVDAQKNQRILACKASCTMGSIMSRLLPGKLK